jgi:hypothetical protein
VDLAARKSFGPKDGEWRAANSTAPAGLATVLFALAEGCLGLTPASERCAAAPPHLTVCLLVSLPAGGSGLVDALEDDSADHLWQWELRDLKASGCTATVLLLDCHCTAARLSPGFCSEMPGALLSAS